MANLNNLREQVKQFVFSSKPSNADSSASCTVNDVNSIVNNLAELLNSFIDELEEKI